MKISVVIPTYNRLDQLQRVLGGFANQTCPLDAFEVLVVSDGSTDGTDDYLRAAIPPFALRPLFQLNQGPAAARNLGIFQAAGDIVLFIDDDVLPAPQLIEEHLCSHDQYGEDAVVIGPMLAPPGVMLSPWVRWEADRLAEQYQDMRADKWAPTARQFYTGNSSIARRHLLECGCFNPSFRRAEDIELAYRLAAQGLTFHFNPLAAGYHYAERSFSAWLETPYAYGRNDVIIYRQCGQSWILPTLINEYHTRNILIKALVRMCLSRPVLNHWSIIILREIILSGERAHLDRLVSRSCSGLFNLRYYQGVADQLGGRKVFWRSLKTAG